MQGGWQPADLAVVEVSATRAAQLAELFPGVAVVTDTPACQAALIAVKLRGGRGLDDILSVIAAPGFSEHHSGDALDLTKPGTEPLSEAFETTPAFDWLPAHAADFGFSLS